MCIRVGTYESKKDAKFLATIYSNRDGELQNTVFAFLASDGKRRLMRTGRGPLHFFDSDKDMAASMKRMLKQHGKGRKPNAKLVGLPFQVDLRRAMNIASCDRRPLLVVRGKNQKTNQKLIEGLAKVAWTDPIVGRCLYVNAPGLKKSKDLVGSDCSSGYLLVAPDDLGMACKVLKTIPFNKSTKKLKEAVTAAIQLHQRVEKNMHDLNRQARRQGIRWETAVPITDSHARGGRRR